MSTIIAIDTGYGNTKYCRRVGGNLQCDLFPSFAPLAQSGSLEAIDSDGGRAMAVVEVDGSKYEVGPEVYDHLPGQFTRILDPDYAKSDQYLALVRGALAMCRRTDPLLQNVDVLVVGLPLDTYVDRQADLAKRLVGAHPLPRIDPRAKAEIRVGTVFVLPQPVGALLGDLTQDSSPRALNRTTLVVDVGFGTLDWYLGVGLRPSSRQCGSARFGVARVLEEVARAISPRAATDDRVHRRIDEAMRQRQPSVTVAGKDHHLNDYEGVVRSVARLGLAAMLRSVERLDSIDRVLLTGGGAAFYAAGLRDMFGDRVVIDPDPVFGNVKGFAAYGQSRLMRSAVAA